MVPRQDQQIALPEAAWSDEGKTWSPLVTYNRMVSKQLYFWRRRNPATDELFG